MGRQPFRQGKSDGTMEEAGAAGGASHLDGYKIMDIPNFYASNLHPYGQNSYNYSNPFTTYVQYFPFIAPKSGNVTKIGIRVNTFSDDRDCQFGVYSDDNGTVGDLMGKVEISEDSASTFDVTQFSATITLVKGTQYWVGYVSEDSSVNNSYWGISTDHLGIVYSGQGGSNQTTRRGARSDNNATNLPASPSAQGYWMSIWPQVYMEMS